VFLSNGGGSNLGFDAFYSAMNKWGRYEIVGSPEEADLIVEVAYRRALYGLSGVADFRRCPQMSAFQQVVLGRCSVM
jgi:hypothetical protein